MAPNGMCYQTPAVPLASLAASLPTNPITEDVDHETIARGAIKQLNNFDASSLTEDAQWRDMLAFTGNLRTFSTPKIIKAAWKERAAVHKPQGFSMIPGSSDIHRMGPFAWVEARFAFTLFPEGRPPSDCYGLVRAIPGNGNDWKIWVICTVLDQIEGYGNVDVMEPLTPELSEKEIAANSIDSGKDFFDCVVVGGGQAGLFCASRLKALGVSHVVLDRNTEVGGNWLTRYKSFSLHTSKEASEMPYGRIFRPEDPYFLTSKHIADGYKRFVERYGLNVWLSSVAKKASWDEKGQIWTLEIECAGTDINKSDGTNGTTNLHHLRARHLVFAMGGGGQIPKMPSYPNRNLFKGEVLHSVAYTSADKWAGKRGVIIGTANTAHDVSADMVNAGLKSVTMVQRDRTMILPLSFYKFLFDPQYNANTDALTVDRVAQIIPISITRSAALAGLHALADQMPEYYDALENAGFRTERYVDLMTLLYERFGGHYFDVGGSKHILDGSVKMKHGTVASFTETGLEFDDGSKLDADVVIFATGFQGNMRHAATEIVGKEVGDRLDDFFGVDAEGEVRGVCKPMVGQKNVWYHGGDIRYARFMSRFLALQIKADLEGTPLEFYRETPA